MSYQLIERPHKQVFAGNPVRYVFNVSNPATPGCAMEVALYVLNIDEDPANAGTLVLRQALYPNPDGKVNFYCEDYLNSQLDWQLPSLANDDVVAVTKQIKRFYIQYRQITKANPSPEWASDQDNVRMVLKGGVAKEKFDRNNFFINHLPTKKPFLTWLPDKHFVGLEERRYLTYFHHYADDTLVPVLKARAVWQDGTQETVSIDFPSLDASKLFHCPAGLKQLGLDALHPDKQLWYFDVSVEDDATATVLATAYRLYADYRKYYHVFSFVYHNSISGMDTLRIRGEWDIETNLNTTDIQQATGGDFSGEILPTENASVNISSYKTFDGDAGWMNTKRMQEACEDLLHSDGVYRELFGRRWLRVLSMNKNQKNGASDDTKWSFPIKWRYTFDNTCFTPEAVDLGDGVMDEAPGALLGTCTAPSGLAKELTDDQPAEQTWHLSWNEVADAEGYQVEITDPNGDVTVHDVTDPEFDLVATIAGDYSWRVRTKCGAADYSGFSYGPGVTVDFTVAGCTTPAALTATIISIDGSNATIRFSYAAVPGVLGYFIEYREVGSTIWQQHYNPQAVTYVDKILQKDTQYECRIQSDCNGTDRGVIVYGPTFIPSNMVGTCNAPTNLVATITGGFIGGRILRFTWTNAAATTDYEFQYRLAGSGGSWVVLDHKNSGFNLVAIADREYEWRLRSNCTGGGYSNFKNGDNFNT